MNNEVAQSLMLVSRRSQAFEPTNSSPFLPQTPSFRFALTLELFGRQPLTFLFSALSFLL